MGKIQITVSLNLYTKQSRLWFRSKILRVYLARVCIMRTKIWGSKKHLTSLASLAHKRPWAGIVSLAAAKDVALKHVTTKDRNTDNLNT